MVSPLNLPGAGPAAGQPHGPRLPQPNAVPPHASAAAKRATQSGNSHVHQPIDKDGFAAKLHDISAAWRRGEKTDAKDPAGKPAAKDGGTGASQTPKPATAPAGSAGAAEAAPAVQPGDIPEDDSHVGSEAATHGASAATDLSVASPLLSAPTVELIAVDSLAASDTPAGSAEKTKRDAGNAVTSGALITLAQADPPSLPVQSAGENDGAGDSAPDSAAIPADGKAPLDGSFLDLIASPDPNDRTRSERPASSDQLFVPGIGAAENAIQSPAMGHPSSGVGDARTASPSSTGGTGVPMEHLEQFLAAPLVKLVSSSQRDMVIRLHPPELGDLTVRVAVSGRDVSTWFETPQPQVQQVISQAINQLQSELGVAGYNLTGAWVGTGSGGSHNAGDRTPLPTPLRIAESQSRNDRANNRQRSGTASGVSIYV